MRLEIVKNIFLTMPWDTVPPMIPNLRPQIAYHYEPWATSGIFSGGNF